MYLNCIRSNQVHKKKSSDNFSHYLLVCVAIKGAWSTHERLMGPPEVPALGVGTYSSLRPSPLLLASCDRAPHVAESRGHTSAYEGGQDQEEGGETTADDMLPW